MFQFGIWMLLIGILCEADATCTIPDGQSTTREPFFWCSLTAKVSLDLSCTVKVEETFEVPWTVEKMYRVLLKQTSQNIDTFTVTQFIAGREARIGVRGTETRSGHAFDVVFQPRVAQRSSKFVLRYETRPGVLGFLPCTHDTTFKKPRIVGRDLITKWRLGGLTVEKINALSVEFEVPKTAGARLVETVYQTERNVSVALRTRSTNETNIYQFTSDKVVERPEDLVFFLRFSRANGVRQCPNFRSCQQEKRNSDLVLANETLTSSSRLALVLGLGLFGVGLAISVLVFCCWRRAKRRNGHDENPNINLPTGFRHFVVDTGDEKSATQWNEWATSAASLRSPGPSPHRPSGKAEAVFVRDITPRSAGDKPDVS